MTCGTVDPLIGRTLTVIYYSTDIEFEDYSTPRNTVSAFTAVSKLLQPEVDQLLRIIGHSLVDFSDRSSWFEFVWAAMAVRTPCSGVYHTFCTPLLYMLEV